MRAKESHTLGAPTMCPVRRGGFGEAPSYHLTPPSACRIGECTSKSLCLNLPICNLGPYSGRPTSTAQNSKARELLLGWKVPQHHSEDNIHLGKVTDTWAQSVDEHNLPLEKARNLSQAHL